MASYLQLAGTLQQPYANPSKQRLEAIRSQKQQLDELEKVVGPESSKAQVRSQRQVWLIGMIASW